MKYQIFNDMTLKVIGEWDDLAQLRRDAVDRDIPAGDVFRLDNGKRVKKIAEYRGSAVFPGLKYWFVSRNKRYIIRVDGSLERIE